MDKKQRFFYCPMCGGRLSYADLGERRRLCCRGCGHVCYENPVVGVAVILFDESGRVLLGKRKSRSYPGLWCIPCGYVEYDEDVYGAAVREFKEETGLAVRITGIYTVQSNFHNPQVHTVGIWFLAEKAGGELKAGADLEEAGFFDPAAPPPLAFPTDAAVLKALAERGPVPGTVIS